MSPTSENPADAPQTAAASEARVARILARTRYELGVRDLLTLAVGSFWSVLLMMGAVLYVIVSQRLR